MVAEKFYLRTTMSVGLTPPVLGKNSPLYTDLLVEAHERGFVLLFYLESCGYGRDRGHSFLLIVHNLGWQGHTSFVLVGIS
jgi:hypothetical protein